MRRASCTYFGRNSACLPTARTLQERSKVSLTCFRLEIKQTEHKTRTPLDLSLCFNASAAQMNSAYSRLLTLTNEISSLQSVTKLLNWDEQAIMPPRGAVARSEQISFVERELHKRKTSNELGDLLAELGSCSQLDENAQFNVRELIRVFERESRVPTDLAQALTNAKLKTYRTWNDARKLNDFSVVAGTLTELVALVRQRIDAISYDGSPYDVVLSDYEPRTAFAELMSVISPLRDSLPQRIEFLQKTTSFDALDLPPPEVFEQIGRRVAADLGFDLESGRIDAGRASSCSGLDSLDVRLVTQINLNNVVDTLYATIHEVGHGLYYQGLPSEHRGTPLGVTNSLSLHESQARWWENFVGRSRPFCERYVPKIWALSGNSQPEAGLFYDYVNRVCPSLIRVEADEVTYNLHAIMRVELEIDLIDGTLSAANLPDAWNAKMETYLGILPDSVNNGVLQDQHWSMGMFGYFGTYILGNVIAAQCHEKLTADIPEFDNLVRSGEFAVLLGWMRDNIHRHGSRYSATELTKRITGRIPDPHAFLRYIDSKFEVVS